MEESVEVRSMSRMSTTRHIAQSTHSQTTPTLRSQSISLDRLAVTVAEGARLLGVGRATLYKLVMRGEIESFTIGRARRIALSTLERYTQSPRTVQSERDDEEAVA